ncbi:hypothetical protein G7Y89_g5384 [Cudoniella acicularis]|uniref:Uncharacterized protein n=1 Tax=Cudoniella acicularis TaxID=354080 RepID=A0A8H4RMJ6_9HELO|nr:hypothetical protein G7Y89_g5384 [Cudoniella acicularis]
MFAWHSALHDEKDTAMIGRRTAASLLPERHPTTLAKLRPSREFSSLYEPADKRFAMSTYSLEEKILDLLRAKESCDKRFVTPTLEAHEATNRKALSENERIRTKNELRILKGLKALGTRTDLNYGSVDFDNTARLLIQMGPVDYDRVLPDFSPLNPLLVVKTVALLLKRVLRPDGCWPIGVRCKSALHFAGLPAKDARPDSMRAFLSGRNIDLNVQDEVGNTSLQEAVKHRNTKLVRLLLADDRVELNNQNHNGDTALLNSYQSNYAASDADPVPEVSYNGATHYDPHHPASYYPSTYSSASHFEDEEFPPLPPVPDQNGTSCGNYYTTNGNSDETSRGRSHSGTRPTSNTNTVFHRTTNSNTTLSTLKSTPDTSSGLLLHAALAASSSVTNAIGSTIIVQNSLVQAGSTVDMSQTFIDSQGTQRMSAEMSRSDFLRMKAKSSEITSSNLVLKIQHHGLME